MPGFELPNTFDYAEPILGSLKPQAPVSMRPANRRSNFGAPVTRRLRSYHLWLLAVETRIEPRAPAATCLVCSALPYELSRTETVIPVPAEVEPSRTST